MVDKTDVITGLFCAMFSVSNFFILFVVFKFQISINFIGSELDAKDYLSRKRSVIPIDMKLNEVSSIGLNESFGSECISVSDDETDQTQNADIEPNLFEIVDEAMTYEQIQLEPENPPGPRVNAQLCGQESDVVNHSRNVSDCSASICNIGWQ